MLLDDLARFVSDIQTAKGSNAKIAAAKKYPHLQSALRLIYDPLKTTGIRKASVLKFKGKARPYKGGLLQLMRDLYARKLTGHQALGSVRAFIDRNKKQHSDLVLNVLEKNLKTHVGVLQLNRAFPGLIQVFSPALGVDFKNAQKYFDKFRNEDWFISRKFDGVRVLAWCDGKGGVRCLSRKGHTLGTLGKLIAVLKKHVHEPVILDGEAHLERNDGAGDNFRDMNSQIRRKNYTIDELNYQVFDCLSEQEFWDQSSDRLFSERNLHLRTLLSCIDNKNQPVKVLCVEQEPFSDVAMESWNRMVGMLNWEGVMLRMDAKYKGRRSKDLLKIKKFQTVDLKVLATVTGVKRDQQEHEYKTMASVVVRYNGKKLNVGSGFSDAERRRFHKHPDQIVGKIIEIQYFQESSKRSLRFPTFKRVLCEI